MALTIHQKPYSFTKCGQALIYRATSTNVANDGFRFVFKVYEDSTLIATLKIAPTPEATPQGLLNLSPIIRNRIESKVDLSNNDFTIDFGSKEYPAYLYKIEVIEGYLVSGVFEEQAATTQTNYHYFFKGLYSFDDGFNPPPARYNLVNDESLLMGGRKIGTHKPPMAFPSLPLGKSTYIPVRKNNLDSGYLYALNDSTDILTAKDSGLSDELYFVRMTLVDGSGTSHVAAVSMDGTGIATIPAYPASLAGTTDFIDPADYPDYQYYYFEIINSVSFLRRSLFYVFYPVESDCKFDNVRLAWYNTYEGGWDYFNFEKKDEQTINVERKRIKRVVGNYSSAMSGFTFNASDRGLMEGMVDVTTSISISTNIISEGEFLLLSSLVQSDDVYIIPDGSSIAIPVVVESNNYTERKMRDGKVYDLNLVIKKSNEYQ